MLLRWSGSESIAGAGLIASQGWAHVRNSSCSPLTSLTSVTLAQLCHARSLVVEDAPLLAVLTAPDLAAVDGVVAVRSVAGAARSVLDEAPLVLRVPVMVSEESFEVGGCGTYVAGVLAPQLDMTTLMSLQLLNSDRMDLLEHARLSPGQTGPESVMVSGVLVRPPRHPVVDVTARTVRTRRSPPRCSSSSTRPPAYAASRPPQSSAVPQHAASCGPGRALRAH